jgi:NADH-quinone oxidoreductase subunit H
MEAFLSTTPGLMLIIAAQSLLVIGFVMISLLFLVYGDRKIWAAVQMRRGPNVVGAFGLLQTVADALKYVVKEVVIPAGADRPVFMLAPLTSFVLALIAWAVIPFNDTWVLADINVAILYVFAVSSLEVYGVIMGGWASNSKYPFLGSLRSAAQMISYEVSIGLIIIGVILSTGSMNFGAIVNAQDTGYGACSAGTGCRICRWWCCSSSRRWPRRTGRPSTCPRRSPSSWRGYQVEYSSTPFLLFMAGEYIAIFLMCALMTLLFFGGWLSPIPGLPDGALWMVAQDGAVLLPLRDGEGRGAALPLRSVDAHRLEGVPAVCRWPGSCSSRSWRSSKSLAGSTHAGRWGYDGWASVAAPSPSSSELVSRFSPDGPSAMLGRQVFNLRGEMKRNGARAARPYDRALSVHSPGQSASQIWCRTTPLPRRCSKRTGLSPGSKAIDISDYEGATHVWDLNQPVPQDWHGRYSFIFDGGTLEHVFNLPQAFANVLNMLRPGGRFVGANPFNGYPSHGMYQFSAELVWTYWVHGCGCRMHACRAIDTRGTYARDLPDPTAEGMRLKLRTGSCGVIGRIPHASALLLWYEIEKLEGAAPPAAVQQSDYVTTWSRASAEAAP